MQTDKERMLYLIAVRAARQAERLAGEFARAASEEREQILAALEFKKWLAASCREALADRPGGNLVNL